MGGESATLIAIAAGCYASEIRNAFDGDADGGDDEEEDGGEDEDDDQDDGDVGYEDDGEVGDD